MKGRYSFTQTAHTAPQGTVAVKVKHNYEGAVPMPWDARIGGYLRQNGHSIAPTLLSPVSDSSLLTVAQRRQLRRAERREHARATRAHYAGSWTAS